jgi:hypothetical protein
MPEHDFCGDCFDTRIKMEQIRHCLRGLSLKTNGTAVRSAAFSGVVRFSAAGMIPGGPPYTSLDFFFP